MESPQAEFCMYPHGTKRKIISKLWLMAHIQRFSELQGLKFEPFLDFGTLIIQLCDALHPKFAIALHAILSLLNEICDCGQVLRFVL